MYNSISIELKISIQLCAGRITTKLDEIKNKCINSEVKVLTTHNAYVLSLCELNLYQQHYTCVTLPGLLDLQQRVQEDLVRQW